VWILLHPLTNLGEVLVSPSPNLLVTESRHATRANQLCLDPPIHRVASDTQLLCGLGRRVFRHPCEYQDEASLLSSADLLGCAHNGVLSQGTALRARNRRLRGHLDKVELRAHATEMIYGDAAYLQGLVQERWPDCTWRIEHVRTRKYVVRGTSRGGKR
jgi:hypothetical protein